MPFKNLIDVFNQTASSQLDKACIKFCKNKTWHSLTWRETRESIIKLAGGLRHLGINPGDRVAIISKTRYEWTLTDMGIMAASAITVPIYESSTASQAEYILNNSQAKIIFVENSVQFNKIKSIHNKLPNLKQIIYFENTGFNDKEDGVYSLEDVMTLGAAKGQTVYEEALNNLTLSDDASFVYTSGTTGEPKGAILTHENFVAEVEGALDVCEIKKEYSALVFLPFAHILGRVAQFFHLYVGHTQCYAESIDKLVDNIADVKPHFMVSVPRIFEKIHARTLQNIENSDAKKRAIFEWAVSTGQKKSQKILDGQKVPLTLALKYKIAHQLVFKKLHQKLGGRIQFFISGGAPLSSDVALFFHAFGFTILEGYGLTETTAGIAFNREHSIKFGTVGQSMKDTNIKIADDGEIIVKGKTVFKGYFNNPKATKESIDKDGWFHTGDIGKFDDKGFLKITDRKKDIIVTAGGKNIAPQSIENLMITDPYISQLIIQGDKRKFLSALVIPDRDQLQIFAKENNISYNDIEELMTNNTIYSFIKERIDQKNKTLASYETIKKFALLPKEFSIETGELTPTLKLKRKAIYQKYADIFDGFYKE